MPISSIFYILLLENERRMIMIRLLTKMVDKISDIIFGDGKYPEIKRENKGLNVLSSVFPSKKIMDIAYKNL